MCDSAALALEQAGSPDLKNFVSHPGRHKIQILARHLNGVFVKPLAVLYISESITCFWKWVFALRGLESRFKHSQKVLKVQSSLNARAIARPGVLLDEAAWLWPETGVRWARLSFSMAKRRVRFRAKSSAEIKISKGNYENNIKPVGHFASGSSCQSVVIRAAR